MVYRPGYVIERLRERIRTRLWDALPEHRYAGVLIALAIGDQRAIETVDWETFTRTGVGHLMSISGLHVTMVSGLVAALARLAVAPAAAARARATRAEGGRRGGGRSRRSAIRCSPDSRCRRSGRFT